MSLQTELLIPGYDKNIQELFNVILLLNLKERLSIKALSDNIFFKEKQTDILAISTEYDIPNLIGQGYQEIPYESYTNTIVNAVINSKEVTEYKTMNFNRTTSLSGTEIGISFKDNVVNITQQMPYKLIKSIEYDFTIKEFFIDIYGFVYILTCYTLIKSHITLNFYKDENHDCVTKLDDIEYLYKVKLDNIKQLLYIDDYLIYYMDTNDKFIECELGRKYYFLKDGQVFFNVIDSTDKVTVQVEHTHFYDWISLLGLNNFYIDGKKISTKYTDKFKNILKFPFNSTLNGMLNYSDFTKDKSYKVDKDIDFIKIEGNFNYEYKKGLFEIVIRADKTLDQPEAKVTMELLHEGQCLKSITGNAVNGIIYFCNLKFIFYKSSYETLIRIPINVTDDYSAKMINKYQYIDENSLIDDFDYLSKIDQYFRRDSIKHQLVETDYENGHFIIRNYIKNSKERSFQKDFKVRLIEKDGTPSILWRQIKSKDYFLSFKTYSVVKTIKPKRTEKKLLNITRKKFNLNLSDIQSGKAGD